MSLKSLLIVVVLVPLVGLAQTVAPSPDFSAPPMVPAAPPPMPPPDPSTVQPGTPPPPSALPPPGYVPGQGQSAYPYSPYGKPKAQEKPGPEVGLMVTESLFGMLTAAGITILPYFLLLSGNVLPDPAPALLMIALFGLTPLAVSQTQVGVANGSRNFQIEAWIPMLVGLGSEALVLTIYYFVNGSSFRPPTILASGGVPQDQGSTIFLFIGSAALVPLIQMAAINLFKTPKQGAFVAAERPAKKPLVVARPSLTPLINPSSGALSGGAAVLSGSF